MKGGWNCGKIATSVACYRKTGAVGENCVRPAKRPNACFEGPIRPDRVASAGTNLTRPCWAKDAIVDAMEAATKPLANPGSTVR